MSAPQEPLAPVPADLGDVRVWFARLEAKLDVALATHGARLEQHGRDISQLCHDVEGHDSRLRELETRPVVSPKAVWTAIGTLAACVAVLLPVLDRLYNIV